MSEASAKIDQPRRYGLAVLVYQDEDQWIAHCLDYDIVTQGDGPSGAMDMMEDALRTVAYTRIEMGLEPFEPRRAPEAEWNAFHAGTSMGFRRVVRIAGGAYDDEITLISHFATVAG